MELASPCTEKWEAGHSFQHNMASEVHQMRKSFAEGPSGRLACEASTQLNDSWVASPCHAAWLWASAGVCIRSATVVFGDP